MGSAFWVVMKCFLNPQLPSMKKISLFMLVLAMAFPISASEAQMIGDVNGDGKISSLDYVRVKNIIMGKN